jgi:hypothetical protein
MAKISQVEISNFQQSFELPYLNAHGKPIYHPPVRKVSS